MKIIPVEIQRHKRKFLVNSFRHQAGAQSHPGPTKESFCHVEQLYTPLVFSVLFLPSRQLTQKQSTKPLCFLRYFEVFFLKSLIVSRQVEVAFFENFGSLHFSCSPLKGACHIAIKGVEIWFVSNLDEKEGVNSISVSGFGIWISP
jgi:hypothetical protein